MVASMFSTDAALSMLAILNNICGIKTNKIETGCRSLKVLLQLFVIYATKLSHYEIFCQAACEYI